MCGNACVQHVGVVCIYALFEIAMPSGDGSLLRINASYADWYNFIYINHASFVSNPHLKSAHAMLELIIHDSLHVYMRIGKGTLRVR